MHGLCPRVQGKCTVEHDLVGWRGTLLCVSLKISKPNHGYKSTAVDYLTPLVAISGEPREENS